MGKSRTIFFYQMRLNWYLFRTRLILCRGMLQEVMLIRVRVRVRVKSSSVGGETWSHQAYLSSLTVLSGSVLLFSRSF